MARSSSSLTVFDGLADVSGRYDGFILDLWGVVHDGVKLFPGVVDCLEHLRAAGKKVVMLSNAPRLSRVIEDQLSAFGVPRSLYEGVVSSGQEAYENLQTRRDPWYASLGTRCYHIGPARDRHLVEGLTLQEVDKVTLADYILNTGPWRDEEKVSDYEEILAAGAKAGVPMICCNPDLEVMRGGVRIICAGALAQRYEALGGEVRYHGKPYPELYDRCLSRMALTDKSRALAIGDSLRTDIAGAKRAGIDSLLVLSGIHGEEVGFVPGRPFDAARVERFLDQAELRPLGVLPALRWA